ncbi:MAG: ABC transporter ATP-binding protein [Actinobacteria bacterium]|nr:ABC transporter ATP-binding protein [Actinomycetota bacterium]
MLEVDGLRVRYGNVLALDGVTLRVDDGEIACILGPSGSGKSTLLRAVAGFEDTTRGTVRWDGEDLGAVPVHRRRFGLMFQDHALFAHRDVLGNVAFGLRMLRLPRDEVAARARDALDRVGLSGFEHRKVRELSGGEQQRVALARSLAPEPRLLMLDEPLGSLDRELRERLVVELHELLRGLGITTLFVTHDQDEAFALADTVVLLRDGRVEQVGTPGEVWANPRTASAARFLGFATIVDVTGSDAGIVSPWGRHPAPKGIASGRVRIGFRPDGLRIDDAGPVPGVVRSSTFRRDHFLVRVDSELGALEVAAAEPVPAGTPVRVAADPGAAVVLPA